MNSDLVFVISKIQFGRITNSRFLEKADAVRELLRKDYPVFTDKNEMRMVEVQLGAQGQQVNETVTPIIVLTSASKDWGVRITTESILLYTTSYDTFTDFQARMRKLIEVVRKEMDVYHTSFVGIRYVNKIFLQGDNSKRFHRQEFLQPELGNWNRAGSNLVSRYQKDTGWLVINSGVTVSGPKLSNDLMELAVDLGEKNQPLDGPWAHLDVDSFTGADGMVEYDLDKLMEQLTDVRSHAKAVYEEVIVE